MQPPPKLSDDGDDINIDRDPTSREEVDDVFDREAARKRKLNNDSDEQDMGERIRYASHAYGITQTWIGFLIVITIAQMAFKKVGLTLDTSVFITVFTTTTASIFGFWLLVGQYLFSRRRDGREM